MSSLPESSPRMNTDLPSWAKFSEPAISSNPFRAARISRNRIVNHSKHPGTLGCDTFASIQRVLRGRHHINGSCADTTLGVWFSSKVSANCPMRPGPRSVAYVLAALFCGICLPNALAEDPGNTSLAEIVRRAVHNEVASNQSSGMHFRFKDEKRTPQLSQTKLIVETRDATAGLLVMQNGQPLTPKQRHEEEARLANYAQSPQELRKKKRDEKEDAEHTERILRALPDA